MIKQSEADSVLEWNHHQLLHLYQHKLFPKLYFFSFHFPGHVPVDGVANCCVMRPLFEVENRKELMSGGDIRRCGGVCHFLGGSAACKRMVQRGNDRKRFQCLGLAIFSGEDKFGGLV